MSAWVQKGTVYGVLRRLRGWLLGYDVFISYTHRDGLGYAMALESWLRSRDWVVFRDALELAAGDHLEEVIFRALDRTRMLIVLVSPESKRSRFMRKEVERFQRAGGRIVSIDVEHSLEPGHPLGLSDQYLGLEEGAEAFQRATPSRKVLIGLQGERAFWRWNRIARLSLAVVLLGLTGLTGLAFHNAVRASTASLERDFQHATAYLSEATRAVATRNHAAARTWASAAIEKQDLASARGLLVEHPAVEPRSQLTWADSDPESVACAPIARWVAVGDTDGLVRVLQLDSAGRLRQHAELSSPLVADVVHLHFDRDESWLFAADWDVGVDSSNRVVAWPIREGEFGDAVEVTSGSQVVGLSTDPSESSGVATFSLLVVTEDAKVARYHEQDGAWHLGGEPYRFEDLDGYGMYSATFNPSHTEMMVVWAGGHARVFRPFSGSSGYRELDLPPHPSSIGGGWDLTAAAYDSGRLEWVVGGTRHFVWRWPENRSRPRDALRPMSTMPNPDASRVTDLLPVSSRTMGSGLLAVCPGRGVLRWDSIEDRLVEIIPTGELTPRAVARCEMVLVVVGSGIDGLGACTSYDLLQRSQRRRFAAPSEVSIAYEHAVSTDQAWFAVAYDDGVVRVWNVDSGRQVWSWKASTQSLRWTGFRPDSSLLGAVGFDGVLRIWDVLRAGVDAETPLEVARAELGAAAYTADWKPDGDCIIAGGSFPFDRGPARCVIWDVDEDGALGQQRTLVLAETIVERIVWGRDGTLAFIVDAGDLVLRDLIHDRERRHSATEDVEYQRLAWTGSGDLLCTTNYGTILFEVATDLTLRELRRYPFVSGPVAAHPHQPIVAVPHGWDAVGLFGDAANPLAAPIVRSSQLESLSFSPDGAWLIASGWQGVTTWVSVVALHWSPAQIAQHVRDTTFMCVVEGDGAAKLQWTATPR